MAINNKNIIWIAIGTFGLSVIGFSFIYRRQIKNTLGEIIDYVFSKENESYLKELHPKASPIFRKFLRDIEKMGYTVKITSGYRTFQEQEKLKKENSSNAQAGFSHHNYGSSLDINLIKDGNWLRKSSTKKDWEKTGIPQLAKNKYNLRWGGDFSGYNDPVHFDLENIYSSKELYAQAIKQFGNIKNVKGNEVKIS